jgi:hypothetical protein
MVVQGHTTAVFTITPSRKYGLPRESTTGFTVEKGEALAKALAVNTSLRDIDLMETYLVKPQERSGSMPWTF